jgi:hypothetical protein
MLIIREMLPGKLDHLGGTVNTYNRPAWNASCDCGSHLPITTAYFEYMFIATEGKFCNQFLCPLLLSRGTGVVISGIPRKGGRMSMCRHIKFLINIIDIAIKF